jgi:hypothetical protein
MNKEALDLIKGQACCIRDAIVNSKDGVIPENVLLYLMCDCIRELCCELEKFSGGKRK